MMIRRILRTRTTHELAHLAIAIAATFALTGADGEGCNLGDLPDETGEPPNPDVPPCPEGLHWEQVCDDHDCGQGEPGDCYELCVPDEVCPEGSYEEWICDEPPFAGDEPSMGYCLDPEGCTDDGQVGACYPICVPFEMCGEGMHEEIICESYPEPGWPDDDAPPPPPDDPDDPWLPGDPDEPPPPPIDACFPICVPDESPPCPPGTFPELDCYERDCWEICVPFDEAEL